MSALRKLFGPSKPDVWKQLAAEIGGEHHDAGPWKRDSVRAEHGEWTITLDSYYDAGSKREYTRLRAPYVNPDGFRFTIYRRGIFSDLGKRLGMQDVDVGHPRFDHDFVIRGNDERKLRALFADRRLRELLEAQPHVHFAVLDDEGVFHRFPKGTDELCFRAPGILKDRKQLEGLFELFAETLDQLCRIGSAYEGKPDVEL